MRAIRVVAVVPQGRWSPALAAAMSPTPTVEVRGTVAAPSDAGAGAAQASPHRPLSLWPGMYNSPVTAALWNARASIFERAVVSWSEQHEGPAQTKLMTKTPEQSRTSVRYPFSTDSALREQYRSPWNYCRIGKLLEDLDALAGTIAVRHCSDEDMTTRPLMLVTASVDKISIKKEVSLECDLELAGVAAWTGRSSMEIRMTVIQPVGVVAGGVGGGGGGSTGLSSEEERDSEQKNDNNVALTANFTFVARDYKTRKAAPINHLAPQTAQEKQLFAEGEARDEKRKRERQLQLSGGGSGLKEKVIKDGERLQALLTDGRVLQEMPALADRNSILIRDTSLENTIICQPQQRNLHGRIFGGFLMCCAYELAYAACYVFVGRRPHFREVDHVDFHRPVDVGDLLRFKSRVLYTETTGDPAGARPLIHIEVVAVVTQPELRSSLISNTFYFTFTVEADESSSPGEPLCVRRVLPATEEEARSVLMRYDADHPAD